jgi:hypothetical protein
MLPHRLVPCFRPAMLHLPMGVSLAPGFHCTQRALARSSNRQALVREGHVLHYVLEDEGLYAPVTRSG